MADSDSDDQFQVPAVKNIKKKKKRLRRVEKKISPAKVKKSHKETVKSIKNKVKTWFDEKMRPFEDLAGDQAMIAKYKKRLLAHVTRLALGPAFPLPRINEAFGFLIETCMHAHINRAKSAKIPPHECLFDLDAK